MPNWSNGNNRAGHRQQIAEQSKFVDRKYFGGGNKIEENLDSFFNNNTIQPKKRKYQTKKIKPHNTARRKSRNFLTNISYNGVKEEDLWDRSFVFDVYVLATKNINPFSLEQKFFGVKKQGDDKYVFFEIVIIYEMEKQKEILAKSIVDTSKKVRGLHHLQVLCKKRLLQMKILKGKKINTWTKIKTKWKEKRRK